MDLPLALTRNVFLLGSEYFNLYLLKGETYAVVEGGVGGMTYPFLKQLDQLRVAPESISHLVVLHSHFDHMMVFPHLKERYPWLKVVSSHRNRAIFSNERILSKIYDSDRRVTAALMERGLISKAPGLSSAPSFPLDVSAEEGSFLDLGKGFRIRFLEVPGHSPDCLCAYEEGEDILFCSDAAGFYAPPDFYRPNYWFSLREAEKSIGKMKALDPEVLCSGHYGVMVGREKVRNHFQRARQSIEDFKGFVEDSVRSGRSVEDIAGEVTKRFSKGFLELFPLQENYHLWRLLVRRTLEHLGMDMEEK